MHRLTTAILFSMVLLGFGPTGLAGGNAASFEIEVSGDTAFSWQGEDAVFIRAIHNPGNGDKQLRIELSPGGRSQQVVFQINVGSTAAGQEEGTYSVGANSGGEIPSMVGVFCEGACSGVMPPLLRVEIGTVIIEEATESAVSGSFEFSSEGLKVGDRVLQPQFVATGKFVAALVD
jgi:hypothetical protein